MNAPATKSRRAARADTSGRLPGSGGFPGKLALNLVTAALATTLVLPLVWMVLTSLKPLEEVGRDTWLPEVWRWSNYAEVFSVPGITFGRWYWNSLLVAATVTFLQVLTSAMAAYAFARLRWPFRDQVFLAYLGTMMVPGLVLMIPNYQIMIFLGLVDTYAGLVLPAAFSAFGTFLLRQFMIGLPTALDEAAAIDGAGPWRRFWDIILPLSRPGLITLAIFTVVGNFHSFFWPLVMLRSTDKYTLPIGLLFFDSTQGQQTNLLMAAIVMTVLPLIVVFVLLQKQLVAGIQLGAVKG